MIKGVNKQVLEVHDTENQYFERILFFVKPEYAGMGEGKLRKEADRLSKGKGKPPKSRLPLRAKYKLALELSLAAGLGAGVTALCNLLF